MTQVGKRPQVPAPDDEHAERAEQIPIARWAHAAITAVTSGGVISSCNSAGAELYGCTPREIIGRPADILIPPERRPDEAVLLHHVLDGDVVQDYLTDRLRCDGTTVAVSVAISRLVDSAGTIWGTVTIARPVGLTTSPPAGRAAIQATRAPPPAGRAAIQATRAPPPAGRAGTRATLAPPPIPGAARRPGPTPGSRATELAERTSGSQDHPIPRTDMGMVAGPGVEPGGPPL